LNRNTASALAIACLAALLLLSCKGPTKPPGNLSGQVVRAPGQAAPVFPVSILLYGKDPFSPGATALQVLTPAGSDSVVTFKFGDEVAHGDFYVVAWRDNDFDHAFTSGDLLGWYDGGTTGGGAPAAIPVHKEHGQNVSVTIRVGLAP
jgi:hypothetical protein